MNTKCHPSRPLDHDLSDNDSDTFLSDSLPTLLLSETDRAHPPPNDFKVKCYSIVAVKSTNNNITLPFNAHSGEPLIATPHDQYEFEEAANDAAKHLADSWLAFVETRSPHSHQLMPHLVYSPSPPKPKQWKLTEQENELKAPGLDSSILSPFTEPPDIEELHALPPFEPPYLDPTSDNYFDQLVAALQLNTDCYKHASANVLQESKKLVKEYILIYFIYQAAHLTQLQALNIVSKQLADALSVYKLPYHKSPAELRAL